MSKPMFNYARRVGENQFSTKSCLPFSQVLECLYRNSR